MKKMVFDVGGTEIKYCVMDSDLERRESGSVPTPKDTQKSFFEVLRQLYLPHKDEVEGIAMSLPGFIDSEKGRCNGGGWLIYNHRTSIAPELSEICGCPVHIANDGKCAAYAELMSGALTDCVNAGVFIIGTGVGGGLIINGKILNGRHYTAGEYSFMRCSYDDWEGENAMLGFRCATTGLLYKYRKLHGLPEDTPLNGKQFFELYFKNEPDAVRALDEFTTDVAKSITNISVLLDLEKVAIGGGISRQSVLIEKIREALDRIFDERGFSFEPALPKPEVVRCRYGSEANLVGAYLYSLE